MRNLRASVTARDDSGSALVLTLIVVTVLSVVIGGTLAFAGTSVKASVQLRDQAAVNYASDGATDAAINSIRQSGYDATSGKCFGTTDTLHLTSFYGSKSAAVTCSPVTGSDVRFGCVTSSDCNRPTAALLTLGDSNETGIDIKSNSGAFKIHGPVVSNSTIKITKGPLATSDAVYARDGSSGCKGSITTDSTPATDKVCENSASSALNADPNYATDATSVPQYRSVPTCPSGTVVMFEPGYYDDAAALSALTGGSCSNKTWWFKPGTYYFDFHNGENDALPTASHLWTVSNGDLVAGTPSGSLSAPTFPGACVSPIASASAQGVQFIFGNDSRWAIDKKVQAEICGTYSSSKPPIVLYGIKTGTESTLSMTGLKTTSTSDNGTFTNVSSIVSTDNANATWTNNATGSQTGSVTLNGFAPTSTIPAGSTLKTATVTVVRNNSHAEASDVRKVTFTPSGGTAITVSLPNTSPHSGVKTDTVSLMGDSADVLATVFHSGSFTGGVAVYSATVKHAGTETVDSVQLNLTYSPPAFRAQTGCVTGAAGDCDLLTTSQFPTTVAYFQGTVYAPLGSVDISMNNQTEQAFTGGVIVRRFTVFGTGSVGYSGPVVSIPDDSPGLGFGVRLATYVCEGTAHCAITGSPSLTSYVLYATCGSACSGGSRPVRVLTWSKHR
jgi:Flp pilus assembly protein TadG